eukprot:TRINITY_DN642_c0_g1_i3.p2 TRINITY_DN642_c0_g1~~TRINITY_DN642_c0_g1_i3.p2  ORF type:complete len:198 (-),score=33.70 TRINITY_DN642_c0_g1_i3:838-1431(-)
MSSEEEPPIQIKVEVESEQDPINVNYNEVLERRILEQKNAKRDDTCCFSPTPKDYDCNYFCSGRFMIQSIPTVFVLGLLGYGLYVYLFLYCVLLLEGALADKIQGYAFSVTFSIAFVLTLVSYIRCIITNPGAIPDGFPSAITTEEGSLLEAFVGLVPFQHTLFFVILRFLNAFPQGQKAIDGKEEENWRTKVLCKM